MRTSRRTSYRRRPRRRWPYPTAVLSTALACGVSLGAGAARAQFHRAEQDREITYWLHDPATSSFRISHDFTVSDPGQRYVHNFVRAGSEVSDPTFIDLDTGEVLASSIVSGRDLNALGIYDDPQPDDAVVVQAELARPVGEGETARIRVIETYTDRERYRMDGEELVWDRSLGRSRNVVKLPPGWMLGSVSVPAVIALDADGLISLRFINPRNDSIHVMIRALPRP